MERLTERYVPNDEKNGISGIKVFESKNKIPLVKVLSGEYLYPAIEKLATYEDLEEQGLLVRLPDDLKKKVYRITYEYTECSNFGETKNNCENYNCNRDCDSQKRFYIVENRLEFMLFCNYYHELGKTVFLTREEAEKKLEEMKKNGK